MAESGLLWFCGRLELAARHACFVVVLWQGRRQQDRPALLWFSGLPPSLPQNHNKQDQPCGLFAPVMGRVLPFFVVKRDGNETANLKNGTIINQNE